MLSFLRAAAIFLLAAGSAFITLGSIAYFVEGDLHPFILEKEPIPLERIWITALHVHVVAAAFALPACLLLLSRFVMRRLPRVHRLVGRVTGGVILFALVPSGMWMALFAKGGVASSVGFLLSGAVVAVATVNGVRYARAREYARHRRAMLHVLAQLSVAVSSRVLLVAFDRAGVDADVAYLAALWLPVVGSAALAFFIGRRAFPLAVLSSQGSRHHVEPRLDHVVHRLVLDSGAR